MEDYWIGDHVIIKSMRHVGKYEGVLPSGKYRIRVNGTYHEVDPVDVEPYDPQEEEQDEFLMEIQPELPARTVDFNPTIDLHIEVLAPSLARENPHVIISHQIKKCREFIHTAIRNQVPQVKIIHGKGTGALKMEVLHLIRHIPEVFIIQEVHQGGAQEVIFRR